MIHPIFKSTKLYGILGFISLVLFIFLSYHKLFFSYDGLYQYTWPINFFINLTFAIFSISVFIFYNFEIDKKHNESYTELIWKSLVTSAVSLIVLIISRYILYFISENDFELEDVHITENSLYNINSVLATILVCNTFFIYKRLSSYLKTSFIDKFWRYLSWGILGSSALALLNNFNPIICFWIPYIILSCALLFISLHIKWVAYFKYKQKLYSMINLFIMFVIAATYLEYFYEKYKTINIIHDISHNVFIMSLLTFSITYPLFSVLVLLFNLPTSSVFENKLDEVKNFQKLSQDTRTAKDENQIYDALLAGCFAATNATTAALLIYKQKNIVHFSNAGMTFEKEELLLIKSILRKNSIKTDQGTIYIKDTGELQFNEEILKLRLKSFVWIPIKVSEELIGYILICSGLKDAFEKDGIEIIETYANQAGLSIKYSRMLEEQLQNERYRASIAIAEKVQKSLLPSKIQDNEHFNIATYYKSSEEVGGDFYDFHQITENKYAILIADVSGKGTSAAFYTAQLKGAFLSLLGFDLDIAEVASRMNDVILQCIDRRNFITMTLLFIDTTKKEISYIRAGHCPMLHYSHSNEELKFINSKGYGLGMVKKIFFDQFLEKRTFNYQEDDIFLLYTDGLLETKNSEDSEFGFERIQQCVSFALNLQANEMLQNVINEMYAFGASKKAQDDCTIILIKIKN